MNIGELKTALSNAKNRLSNTWYDSSVDDVDGAVGEVIEVCNKTLDELERLDARIAAIEMSIQQGRGSIGFD